MNFRDMMRSRMHTGALSALAVAAGLSISSTASAIDPVTLIEPVDGSNIQVYTVGTGLPPSISVEALAQIGGGTFANTSGSRVTFTAPNVDFKVGTTTTAGQDDGDGEWEGIVDLLDDPNSASPFDDGMGTLSFDATVQALATVADYYDEETTVTDSSTVTVYVTDISADDDNGDGIPNPDVLADLFLGVPVQVVIPGASGATLTVTTTNISDLTPGTTVTVDSVVQADVYYGGTVGASISVTAPTLGDLQAIPGLATNLALQNATNAVLIVETSSHAGDLTSDVDDDPATKQAGLLPAFVHISILLSSDGVTWTALVLGEGESIPANTIQVEVVVTGFVGTITRLRQYIFPVVYVPADHDFAAGVDADWTLHGDTNDAPVVTDFSRSINLDGTGDLTEPGSIIGVRVNNAGAGGGGGSGDTCFIATAAYGTPMAEEINTLRQVRDTYMMNNVAGSTFVDSYYRVAPFIADKVADSPALAAVVRALLTPFILLGKLILAAPMAVVALMLAGAGLVLAHRKTRITNS